MKCLNQIRNALQAGYWAQSAGWRVRYKSYPIAMGVGDKGDYIFTNTDGARRRIEAYLVWNAAKAGCLDLMIEALMSVEVT
jgi:hypothetical protein